VLQAPAAGLPGKKAANARVLLELGADANEAWTAGIRPIHAVEKGEKELLDALLAHGADINATYGEGRTLLHRQIDAGPQLQRRWLEHLKAKGFDFSLRWRNQSYSEYWQQRHRSGSPLADLHNLVQESSTAL